MPRFMVEISRRAYELLEAEAKADRRRAPDQAGILLEQMLESKADAETLAPGVNGMALGDASGNIQIDDQVLRSTEQLKREGRVTTDPVAATAADPKGDVHKPR